jgi:hypothetical protein
MLECLHAILRPIVRLLLLCGIGYREFAAIAKRTFVEVASEEYGIRGRPTNASRVAAMTGLSRKEVSRIRMDAPRAPWSPYTQTTPISMILHYWHFDPDFSEIPGKPKVLPLEGEHSFSALVRRYAGDIPPGALKTEFTRSGVALEHQNETLSVVRPYASPSSFDEDYIRKVAFSLRNLGGTISHNALVQGASSRPRSRVEYGRFERFAHSDWLTADSIREFEYWVRAEGARFLEAADHWIGTHEIPRNARDNAAPRNVGVGMYFFIDD